MRKHESLKPPLPLLSMIHLVDLRFLHIHTRERRRKSRFQHCETVEGHLRSQYSIQSCDSFLVPVGEFYVASKVEEEEEADSEFSIAERPPPLDLRRREIFLPLSLSLTRKAAVNQRHRDGDSLQSAAPLHSRSAGRGDHRSKNISRLFYTLSVIHFIPDNYFIHKFARERLTTFHGNISHYFNEISSNDAMLLMEEVQCMQPSSIISIGS